MYFVPAFCISIMQKKLYAHICDQYVIVRKILIYPFGLSVPLNPNPPTIPPTPCQPPTGWLPSVLFLSYRRPRTLQTQPIHKSIEEKVKPTKTVVSGYKKYFAWFVRKGWIDPRITLITHNNFSSVWIWTLSLSWQKRALITKRPRLHPEAIIDGIKTAVYHHPRHVRPVCWFIKHFWLFVHALLHIHTPLQPPGPLVTPVNSRQNSTDTWHLALVGEIINILFFLLSKCFNLL